MADPTEIQESPIVKYDTAPYKLDRDYRSGHHCTRNSAMASILLSNPSYACNNETIIKLMGKGMRVFNFSERTFPNDIKNRHMENPKLDYPYRDGGLPMWNAIQKFTKEYVDLYYDNDQDVLNDYELQAWAEELGGDRKKGNCGLNGFPTRISSSGEVARIIGQIIFTCTAHHSTIHYPQYQYAGYLPNMPSSLYQSPDIPAEQYKTEKQFVRFFPDFRMAFNQTLVYYMVCFRVNRIGEYDLFAFDKKAVPVIIRHRQTLHEIAKQHQEKYRDGKQKYPFMDPSQIPNSVTA